MNPTTTPVFFNIYFWETQQWTSKTTGCFILTVSLLFTRTLRLSGYHIDLFTRGFTCMHLSTQVPSVLASSHLRPWAHLNVQFLTSQLQRIKPQSRCSTEARLFWAFSWSPLRSEFCTTTQFQARNLFLSYIKTKLLSTGFFWLSQIWGAKSFFKSALLTKNWNRTSTFVFTTMTQHQLPLRMPSEGLHLTPAPTIGTPGPSKITTCPAVQFFYFMQELWSCSAKIGLQRRLQAVSVVPLPDARLAWTCPKSRDRFQKPKVQYQSQRAYTADYTQGFGQSPCYQSPELRSKVHRWEGSEKSLQ